MHEPNVARLLERLQPSDLVLDVGGWACPFNRAQWVIDAEPYETRGFYRTIGRAASQGGDREWFSADTWVRRDICGTEPWPFADKQFDFAVCSHTLEDVRDPLRVCSELIRVARRGYIEVPSRAWETSRGAEHPRLAGLSHHRWLIEIHDRRVVFLQKFHRIHCHWRFSLPRSWAERLPVDGAVQWLWWEGSFECEERVVHGLDAIDAELERFVQATRPYPAWRLALDRQYRASRSLVARAWSRARQSVGGS